MSVLSSLLRIGICCRRIHIHRHKDWSPVYVRYISNAQATDNANVSHSQFIASANSSSKWKKNGSGTVENGGLEPPGDDFENVVEGQGKLSPTSSHLFKLILPLGYLTSSKKDGSHYKNITPPPPTVILLHPSQPLSHVSRLIVGSLAPASPTISFRSTSSRGKPYQWSDSTDVGDFIRDAARAAKFSIYITYDAPVGSTGEPAAKNDSGNAQEPYEAVIDIKVPTFEDRTRYLKRRLELVTQRLQDMESLKQQCDQEARRGARRMALGGFGMLVVYWGAVARLTFWDYGWDVMEPITYLSGLSTVVCGYLWFLYQGREVSYSSVLDSSVSSRRETLYKRRGLDIDRWMELVGEAKSLKREIGKIAEDYDEDRREREEEGDKDNIREDDGEGEKKADAERADMAEANTKI